VGPKGVAWKESLELGAESAAQVAASAGTAEDVALAAAAEARLRSLLSRPLLDVGDTGEAGLFVSTSFGTSRRS
jgi:hypothetical protein